jgi:hypothetical protein
MNAPSRRVIDELWSGVRQGAVIAAVTLVVALPLVAYWRSATSASPVPTTPLADQIPARASFGAVSPPGDVRQVAEWVAASGDNGSAPFVIVDKRRTHVYVFEPAGRLTGDSPVLLGFAPGDHTVPGIGNRPIHLVRPDERTTPAGRFVSRPGRNAQQEEVVWVDYDAAVSMHRVRATDPRERRLERLATPTPADNRISYGCINVPVSFFEQVIWPAIGGRQALVYVLPEVEPLAAIFPAAAARASRNGGARATGESDLFVVGVRSSD